MKIGVTGSAIICEAIKKSVEKRLPSLEVLYRITSTYQDCVDEVIQLQREGVDGILFTGPTNYQYTAKRVTSTVPWTFLPHNQSVLMKGLLESTLHYNLPLDCISVDMYEEELVADTLREIGIADPQIYRAAVFDPEQADLEESILKMHRFHYYQLGAKICFTNMEHIYQPLMEEGIPCIRFSATEQMIMEQIHNLEIQELSARENRGSIATLQIYFNFSFDNERDLAIREWDKIHFQNEMKELIYSAAHRIGAAAFSDGASLFYIMTSRRILMDQFIQNGEYQILLNQGNREFWSKTWIGIGIGNTPLESKSRAAMALNHSYSDPSGLFYIAEEDDKVRGLPLSVPTPQDNYLLHQLHLSDKLFTSLKEVLSAHDNRITSDQLAEALSITRRSANRLIARLEQNHCVTTVGKVGDGPGRPTRLLKITLPR